MATPVDILALRESVVAEARTWLKTKFHHQARKKGVGVDCAMLSLEVGREAGVFPVDVRTFRKVTQRYGRHPDPERMRAAFLELGAVEITAAEATIGDVAWMHWGNLMPIHTAIIADIDGRASLIHAIWNDEVREHGFDDNWRKLVFSYWRYPGIAEALA